MDMVLAISTVETTENIDKGILDNVAYIFDWLQRLAFLYPAVVIIVSFVITLFYFRKKCRRITKEQIKNYSSVGKYIRGYSLS